MAPRKGKVQQEQVQVSLGPQVREGEVVFGVAHIFASFNDTFVHVTDLSGRYVYLCRVRDLRFVLVHTFKSCSGHGNLPSPLVLSIDDQIFCPVYTVTSLLCVCVYIYMIVINDSIATKRCFQ
jgi:hypothetical protein